MLDRLEGYLRDRFYALVTFYCHTYEVSHSVEPESYVIKCIDNKILSPCQCWYSGAVGLVGFDGTPNNGLTVRIFLIKMVYLSSS